MFKQEPGNAPQYPKQLLPGDRPGLRPVMLLYLYVLVTLLLAGSYLQSLHFEYGMIATQVFIILLPAIWYWRASGVDQVSFARLNRLPLRFVPVIILLAVSFWLINIFIAAVLVGSLVNLGYEPLVLIEPPTTWQQYLGYLVVLVVFAGICEEVLFRGTIMPALERYGPVPAIVFSSLLFALLHGSFLNLISAFCLGVVMAVIVIKSNSLWGGILYHMLNNFFAATYLFLAGQAGIEQPALELQTYLALLPFLLLGLAGAVAGLRQLGRHSDREPLLKNRNGWLLAGWSGWPFLISLILFLLLACLELAIGFKWLEIPIIEY